MRNILLLQLETKVALAIIVIVLAIFLFTIFRSIDKLNKFTAQYESQLQEYEEIRVEKNP